MKKVFYSERRQALTAVIQGATLLAIGFALNIGLIGQYVPPAWWIVVAIYLFASLVVYFGSGFTIAAYRRRNGIKQDLHGNFELGIVSLGQSITVFVTFLTVLWALDIPFQTFLTSISLFGVALVLIFRDYISNYLDSFRLMFSTDFKLGDYVKVGENSRGVINDISFRATKLRTDEGDVLYIPNTKFITSEVVNYSKVKYKRITVPFSLPTESIHPVTALEARLCEHLHTCFPELIHDNKLFLRIKDISEWHTHFSFEVSVDAYSFSTEDKIVKALYSEILEYVASRPACAPQR